MSANALLNPLKHINPFKNAKEAVAGMMPKPPTPADVPVRGAEPADPKLKERASTEFATREAAVQRQAAAAGAQRSENEADLLGYTPARRRSAARTLLG